ncbi:hypothetical protein AK830_g592 [Neonectria ditissima]|uniref:Uncharacterized protein n=1 Tax=Neonectria ditissima TaxID=78410 RepID=A0A0P7BXW5_9HYPO|nr:hypothetical protein AK830_g592 [Neonectria ditissima]
MLSKPTQINHISLERRTRRPAQASEQLIKARRHRRELQLKRIVIFIMIGRLLTQKLGAFMGDSHQQQQQPHYRQDPYQVQNAYHHNTHQNFVNGPHPSPYHCEQPQVMNGGYYTTAPIPSKRQHRAERRAERHYRHAERSMQRAEHRAERDFRRAERRGELVPVAPAMYHQPAVDGQMYSRQPNGYEMREMGYQPRQDVHTPASANREVEGAPPPAYEEVERKQ